VIEIASGVVLEDIHNILLHHTKKKYKERKIEPTALFVHHTGADNGRDSIQAWTATAGYHVISKKWPGIAYHYGITRRPSETRSGKLIVHQLNPESTVCYHTKGCNRFGVGLVLQGNLGETELTDFQIECLEAFLPFWFQTHGLSPKESLGWHSNSFKWLGIPKPACPGKNAVKWLKDYLAHC